METILEQSQRRFPFDDDCRIAFLIGANEQKQQDIRAAECAFEWFWSHAKHLSYKKAKEMFKHRFYGYLNNEEWK